MGAGAASQPSADPRLSCSSAYRRPVQPLDRRCPRPGTTGIAAPDGGKFRRTRRGCDRDASDRADFGTIPLSLSQLRSGARLVAGGTSAPASLRDRAEQAASVLPPLLVAAERVAANVAQGVHGRRRVGQGETFWQFRQYQPGDAASRIDWRESAKSQRLYVRETEWEAAQSVWLWRDASASMDYSSAEYLTGAEWPTKRDRAELLLVALASLLVRGGERLTLLGSGVMPMSGRIGLSRVVDFLGSNKAALARFAAVGLKGHVLQIVDPAEEDLPFEGRVRFSGVEERDEVLVSRVEGIRSQYAGRFRDHRAGLATIAGR